MRTIMFLIALAACFAVWDRLANGGVYIAAVEHSIQGAAQRLPG